ncbi:20263_t:CDS:2 [Gigaspora margarita]|uniref:20263_t:CDS:1 n=1 Tax=Gigaspora margarita TaxID=4874 RepID=A0ABM8W259_GIGMA|nr:20263_t:CDS:2 [Gigaspora margarita]
MAKISQKEVLNIHKELLSAEHKIENILLSDLCKIIDYVLRIETRIYLIQTKSIEAAEKALKRRQDQKNAFGVFNNLQMSYIYEICSKANYFLGCCYKNGVGYDRNENVALYHFNIATKAGL